MTARLRLAAPADAAAIAAIYAPYCTDHINSFETEPPGAEEMAARIAKTLQQFCWLVLDTGSDVAGYAYASRHRERAAYRWSVDVAVYVNTKHQRKGVGRRLYEALLPVLAAQNYYRAYAGIALPNEASIGLHEAVGFEPTGIYHAVGYKLGAWRDTGWWERELQPLRNPPGEPRSLSVFAAAELDLLLRDK
jgi:L-amino acid N-acyltransferase YncA